jgi:hypothetical protein
LYKHRQQFGPKTTFKFTSATPKPNVKPILQSKLDKAVDTLDYASDFKLRPLSDFGQKKEVFDQHLSRYEEQLQKQNDERLLLRE